MKFSKRCSRLLALAATILMPGQIVARQPDTFEKAIDNGDFAGAAEEIQKLMVQRRLKSGSDPLLDAHYGRFFAALAQGTVAAPYLIRAIAAASNREQRDELTFELARSREVDGFVASAEAEYRRLSTADTDPEVRWDSVLALARVRLGASPEEAITLLTPLTDAGLPASRRWEAHLLLSRAFAIQGRPSEERAALSAAWEEAPFASSPADAVSVTSMDMAIDRAAASDRHATIGLISVGQSNLRFAGVAQLPVCGGLIRPDDSVTVAIAADPKQRPIYSAVRASRPGIAQLFIVPLTMAPQQIDGSAMYVTLRCRSAIDPNIRFGAGALPNLGSWMAEKGFYPELRPIDPDAGDPLSQLKKRVQELAEKAGPDAPVLAPLLLQVAFLQGAQSKFTNSGNFADANSVAERALRILRTAGAPVEIVEQLRFQTTIALAQNQNIADVTGPGALQTLEALVSRAGTTPPQAFAVANQMSQWKVRPADRVALAERLLQFFDARNIAAKDPIRQAVELGRVAALREIGTTAGIKDRLQAHGLANDLCAGEDRPPSIPPAAVTLTSDDYPKDLLRRNVTGQTTIEVSVSASGMIESERIIASQPAGLFDSVTADKFRAVMLLPARRDGQSTACRGFVQTLRWQIPAQSNFSSSYEGFSYFQE